MMIGSKPLCIVLMTLASIAILLSLLAAVLGPYFPQGHCDFCVLGPILVMIGAVNFVFGIVPLVLGILGVYFDKKVEVFGVLAICFYIFAVPNIFALGAVTSAFADYSHVESQLSMAYIILLIIIYLLEIVISSVCLRIIKFKGCCAQRNDEENLEEFKG